MKFYFCRVSTFVFLGNCEFACPLCLADLVAPFNLYLLWILSCQFLGDVTFSMVLDPVCGEPSWRFILICIHGRSTVQYCSPI